MPGIGAFALSYFESVYKGLPKPLLLMLAHADLKEIDWQRIEGFTPQEILDYFAKELFEKRDTRDSGFSAESFGFAPHDPFNGQCPYLAPHASRIREHARE